VIKRIVFVALTVATFLVLNVVPALADYWQGH
jgi:hypothetical protein